MKQTKELTISKTMRIPVPVVRDMEQEAHEKDTTFSEIAINRLQHHQNQLTPALLAKLQDVANLATEAAVEASPEKAEKVQQEVAAICKSLK